MRNHFCLSQFVIESEVFMIMKDVGLVMGDGVAVLLSFTYFRFYLNSSKGFEAKALSQLHKYILIGY